MFGLCGKKGDVKAFFGNAVCASEHGLPAAVMPARLSGPVTLPRARVAVYEAPGAPPRILDIEPLPVRDYIEALAATVHRLAAEQGSVIPYSVIREVAENFIHAGFAEPVVTILDHGRTIRFADQGPGILDKDRAVLPGFTTATSEMKAHIRGVGSGLPLVKDFLVFHGGTLTIEDNLGRGSVVTLSTGPSTYSSRTGSVPTRPALSEPPARPSQADRSSAESLFDPAVQPDLHHPTGHRRPLTKRQLQVLALVMESGSAGPSLVSRELGVGVSTAYRDLATLEDLGLITAVGGKRTLTEKGVSYLDDLTGGS